MTHVHGSRLACAIGAMLALVLAVQPASAQTLTTGTLSGVVADQQGAALPGVTVVAVHEPTGTRYETITGGDGRFQIPNVRVGGPYSVTATLSGFRDQTQSNTTVALGEEKPLDFRLPLAPLSETVTVVGQSTFGARLAERRLADDVDRFREGQRRRPVDVQRDARRHGLECRL